MSPQHRPPSFSLTSAVEIAREHFGIVAFAATLPSERDQNFLLRDGGQDFVLKVAQASEDLALLECQNAILERLHAAQLPFAFPRLRDAVNGARIAQVQGEAGAVHHVRLVDYLPGVPLAAVRPHSHELIGQIGALLGAVDRTLQDFAHPAAQRDFYWDLRNALRVIEEHRSDIPNARRRQLLAAMQPQFERAAAFDPMLRRSVIHNDANDYNLIVRAPTPADPFEPARITGLIDFGDVVHTWTLAEVAIGAAYAMLGKTDAMAVAEALVAGYHNEFPIPEAELEALFPLICSRIGMSVTLAAAQRMQHPDNEYLSISERPAWTLLQQLATIDPSYAHYRFRAACGFEACPTAARVTTWLRDSSAAALLPDHDLATAIVLDFSVQSTQFGEIAHDQDVRVWSDAVFGVMRRAGASVGLGRYDEARPWYTARAFRSEGLDKPEWRTIHIGVDIFAEAGTAVAAPFDAIVHSVYDNAGHLDYGPTIILRHDISAELRFYTLYGHLSRESLAGLQPGDRITAGQRLATLGDEQVNGGWTPHLHFQIINNLLGRTHEFPGVARPSERALWLSVSPDPNLVLRLPQLSPAPRPSCADLLEQRTARIGASLSIAYHSPLVIVRGWMQNLYDENGQAYLDAVNNVAHVGHSHPRVVEAMRRQAAVLNTNTRYLHENLTRYAQRLTATLPDPLRVCFFVCSGSEANELALRMARAHTRTHDVIVIDAAYHGNTTALIELSPYKFKGPGGAGAPEHVQVVPLPDPYRGLHRGSDLEVGHRYAAYVQGAIERIHARSQRVSAFFAEPLPGCGGQVVPPPGYLREAFALVHAAGGVCVADEVQTGLGRAGSHFWAFETQDVVPDIVTMGKPIGNGHPLGAVITTPEIAASFNNGMEYFNTFGGNPVSCAVGMAVLDVLEDEELQANALHVGTRLLTGLGEIAARHSMVGDVRGRGLYVGVELVLDPEQRTPAGACASYVANRMRERGTLLSTDGPDHNVLKIKPPMVFNVEDADRLVSVLDDILGENAVRLM
jgi:4-aminobutyrate aminotransferase-like enzyme/Ser/Thr protein kinase RdoA (MazF antagonist)